MLPRAYGEQHVAYFRIQKNIRRFESNKLGQHIDLGLCRNDTEAHADTDGDTAAVV